MSGEYSAFYSYCRPAPLSRKPMNDAVRFSDFLALGAFEGWFWSFSRTKQVAGEIGYFGFRFGAAGLQVSSGFAKGGGWRILAG